MMPYIIIAVIVIVLIILVSRIKIVPQAQIYVIERLGSFYTEWNTGIHMLVPFIDKISKKVSIKEQVVDFKPQSVITKDNASMQIDTVVFFQVTNPQKYAYGVERPLSAIENLCATTLRNLVGELVFDDTLISRDRINTKITQILDEATDRWGIKVNRVELKNIIPPHDIMAAMEKQMKAERESREKILLAEGQKKSQITVAEGEKESKILRAEADKQSEILRAEAEQTAMILHADAVRQQKILEAQGEAESINMVQQALADSLVKLNNANPNNQVIALKGLEAFAKAADGKATKIIIPSEIQGLAGLVTSVKELVSPEGDINIVNKK